MNQKVTCGIAWIGQSVPQPKASGGRGNFPLFPGSNDVHNRWGTQSAPPVAELSWCRFQHAFQQCPGLLECKRDAEQIGLSAMIEFLIAGGMGARESENDVPRRLPRE